MSRSPSAVALRAAQVATPRTMHRPGWVAVEGDTIVGCAAGDPPAGLTVVDLGDRILAPGFVDLHVHGGAGAQVNGEDADEVREAVHRLAALHARHGTTSLLATTVSDTSRRLRTALTGIARARETRPPGTATVLGAHLEGPWLSPQRAGAQNPAVLREPDDGELRSLLGTAPGTLRMVTLAPELPGALEAIATMTVAGVVASVGHTDADLEVTRRAFASGARHVTHLFNAMPGIHHRRPGPVVAALRDDRVSVEVIADGHHLHRDVLALVAALVPRRMVAVTDATSAAGLPPGDHRLGDLPVTVRDGRVALTDAPATLAGSTLTLDRAVATLVRDAGVELTVALTAATLTPATVVGARGKGVLAVGADADLTVLEPDLSVAATVTGGRPAHDPDDLLVPLVAATRQAGPGSAG